MSLWGMLAAMGCFGALTGYLFGVAVGKRLGEDSMRKFVEQNYDISDKFIIDLTADEVRES